MPDLWRRAFMPRRRNGSGRDCARSVPHGHARSCMVLHIGHRRAAGNGATAVGFAWDLLVLPVRIELTTSPLGEGSFSRSSMSKNPPWPRIPSLPIQPEPGNHISPKTTRFLEAFNLYRKSVISGYVLVMTSEHLPVNMQGQAEYRRGFSRNVFVPLPAADCCRVEFQNVVCKPLETCVRSLQQTGSLWVLYVFSWPLRSLSIMPEGCTSSGIRCCPA